MTTLKGHCLVKIEREITWLRNNKEEIFCPTNRMNLFIRMRRSSIGCGVAQLGCGAAQPGCDVTQLVVLVPILQGRPELKSGLPLSYNCDEAMAPMAMDDCFLCT